METRQFHAVQDWQAFKPGANVRKRPLADIPKRRQSVRVTDYADLDPTNGKWVEATSSTLFTEWVGEPSRYFHLPGEPPFECFQIVVFPPAGNDVTVQAASLDTNDGAEMMQIWEGSTASLNDMLTVAVATVDLWRARLKEQSAGS